MSSPELCLSLSLVGRGGERWHTSSCQGPMEEQSSVAWIPSVLSQDEAFQAGSSFLVPYLVYLGNQSLVGQLTFVVLILYSVLSPGREPLKKVLG